MEKTPKELRKEKQQKYYAEHIEEFKKRILEAHRISDYDVAEAFYLLGIDPNATTSIADTISYGYGRLDSNGFWEYQLHNSIMD